MNRNDDITSVRTWLDGLGEEEVRDLLDDATQRVDGLADRLETRRAAASDDPADLLAIVNRDLTPSRRFYDYWQANRYATEAYDTVGLLEAQSAAATPALIPVTDTKRRSIAWRPHGIRSASRRLTKYRTRMSEVCSTLPSWILHSSLKPNNSSTRWPQP